MKFTILLFALVVTAHAKEHGSWSDLTPMPVGISDMSTTQVGSTVYFVGGCLGGQVYNADAQFYGCTGITDTVLVYNIDTETYFSLPPAPRPRYRHGAAALNGKLYVFGGRTAEDALIPEVDVFDMATQTWSLYGIMTNPASDLSGFSDGEKIYAVGGYDADYTSQSQVQTLKPPNTNWTAGPSLNSPRGDIAVVYDARGSFAMAIGGWSESNNFAAPMPTVELLDLSVPAAALSWKVVASLAKGRGDKAGVVVNGDVFVIGGEVLSEGGYSAAQESVELYDRSDDSWTTLSQQPDQPRFRFGAVAGDDAILIFGGQGDIFGTPNTAGSLYPVLSSVEQYSFKTTTASPSQQRFNDDNDKDDDDDDDNQGIYIALVVTLPVVFAAIVIMLIHYKLQRSNGQSNVRSNDTGKHFENPVFSKNEYLESSA
eukprot:m.86157 g.86157  ORF g.86157 m.86157 type:complete len:428 (-) comp21312_c0_seq1:154-1437(-)